jgi:hypothetical protein
MFRARPRPDRCGMRWMGVVTWVAVIAPVPYGLSRATWAAGIPFGIEEELLRDFQSPGWGSLYILLLAGLSEGTALFTHAFLVRGRRAFPAWVPLLGRRAARRWAVAGPLLVPIAILAWFNVWSLGPIGDGFTIPEGNAGLPGWSFWGQVATFWIWGISLATATVVYVRRGAR